MIGNLVISYGVKVVKFDRGWIWLFLGNGGVWKNMRFIVLGSYLYWLVVCMVVFWFFCGVDVDGVFCVFLFFVYYGWIWLLLLDLFVLCWLCISLILLIVFFVVVGGLVG